MNELTLISGESTLNFPRLKYEQKISEINLFCS